MARLVKMRAKRFNVPLVYGDHGDVIVWDIKSNKKKIINAATKM